MTHTPSRRIVWFFVAALVATAVRAPSMQAPGASGSLRPALNAAGSGEVRFRIFRYRALP